MEALSWIKHGADFNQVCNLAGRDGNYVKAKMLDRAIEREERLLGRRWEEYVKIAKAMDI